MVLISSARQVLFSSFLELISGIFLLSQLTLVSRRTSAHMSSADALSDDVATVSGLYGPGTMMGWYIVTLAVVVAWTLDPQKRRSGTIDGDLIAVLTLSTAAAVDLVRQGRAFWETNDRDALESLLNSTTLAEAAAHGDPVAAQYRQSVVTFEAPHSVACTYVLIGAVLDVVSLWTGSARRTLLLGLVDGLLSAVYFFLAVPLRIDVFESLIRRAAYFCTLTLSRSFVTFLSTRRDMPELFAAISTW